ncbi:MAG: ATP phosphoribosyltransferase [Candidatus Saccharimonadales bacterium]
MKNSNIQAPGRGLAYQDATIAIQAKGRLTLNSLQWLNNNTGTEFLLTETPFENNPRRELLDTATGITLLGFSNRDTMKAVACGLADLGICGEDIYREYEDTGSDNEPYCTYIERRLGFSKSRLVLATPNDAQRPINRVITSYPRQASYYLGLNGMRNTQIEYYTGGVEMIARRRGCDFVDICDTGGSMTGNDYREVATICSYEAVLVGATTTTTSAVYDYMNWYDWLSRATNSEIRV